MKQRSRPRSVAPLRPRTLLSMFTVSGSIEPDAPLSASELFAHPDSTALVELYSTHCKSLSHEQYMALLLCAADLSCDWDQVQARLGLPVPYPLRERLNSRIRTRIVPDSAVGSTGCVVLELLDHNLFIPCLIDADFDDGALFGLPEHSRQAALGGGRRLAQWLREAVASA